MNQPQKPSDPAQVRQPSGDSSPIIAELADTPIVANVVPPIDAKRALPPVKTPTPHNASHPQDAPPIEVDETIEAVQIAAKRSPGPQDQPSWPTTGAPHFPSVTFEADTAAATAIREADAVAASVAGALPQEQPTRAATPTGRSWVFRCVDFCYAGIEHLFGIVSVMLLLAMAASVPILQLISFGYLLEVSGRLARGKKLRDAMVGLSKARVLGGAILGAWLCLLPIRMISDVWFDAYLVDPASSQTAFLRFAQLALIVLTVAHVVAALLCGGKLRYFFWPLVAPISFAIWLPRRLAGVSIFRSILNVCTGWISKSLPNDICNAKPIGDWFLPAIVWRRIRKGRLYPDLRDGLWDFFHSLRLDYYFVLGAKGFAGTFMWLLLPTSLLVVSAYNEGAAAGFTFLAGLLFALPIFAAVPFIQTHFSQDGKFRRFLEPWKTFKNFGRAPLAHVLALLIMLVMALPLFLLKIETIPSELMWTLSLVFVMFSWPAKIAVGLAYRRGARKEKSSRWFIRYPLVLLTLPVSLAFVLIFTGTRYTSWLGALSLFENHVFLLPVPFWIS